MIDVSLNESMKFRFIKERRNMSKHAFDAKWSCDELGTPSQLCPKFMQILSGTAGNPGNNLGFLGTSWR